MFGKYVVDHCDEDRYVRVWDINSLMDAESTHESALLCSLDLGRPFKCEKLFGDQFQLYFYGFELKESVWP